MTNLFNISRHSFSILLAILRHMSIQLSKPLKTLLKVVVTLAICGYLFWLIYTKREEYTSLLASCVTVDNRGSIVLLVVLIVINWAFEALKWKKLVEPVEELTFYEAYKSVLIGLSMGLITPRSVGDYIGRLLIIKSPEKHSLVGSLILSRVNQMVATLLFGLLAVYYYLMNYNKALPLHYSFAIFSLLAIVVGFLLRKKVLVILFNTVIGKRIKKYVVIIRAYSIKNVLSIFGYSIVRYIVFSYQYFILLEMLGVEVETVNLLAIIAITFLAKSMMFSVNFIADMSVRQLTAAGIMGLVGISESVAVMGSFGLWGMNILLPAFVGVFYLINIKWRLVE